MPLEKSLLALTKVGGEWKELARPGKLHHEELISSLKLLNGPTGLEVLHGERMLQCAVTVSEGLHGPEAVLRF